MNFGDIPAKIPIAMLVFALFFITGTAIVLDMTNYYGVSVSTDYMGDSTFTQNITSRVENATSSYQTDLTDPLSTDISQDSLASRAWKSIKNTFSLFPLIITILEKMAEALHIPSIFVGVAFTVVVIVFLFALILLVWGALFR